MFGLDTTVIALIVLAALSAGGIAWALMFDRVSNENAAIKRLERITDATPKVEEATGGRKKSMQKALQEFEERQKARADLTRKPPLSVRLTQAGLEWSRQTYILFSIAIGAGFGLLLFIVSHNWMVGAGGTVIGFLGLPNWVINFRRKRRQKQFLEELPNAIDLIVRGIRSGLPLGDCLRMISTETKEPVKSEFRTIVESQQLGVPIGDACLKLYERMPVQEANFFGIVIAIQQKAGGNLSEALSNLSKVLRDRKKMKAKIQAMSMEAKSSAGIIGSLPFIVSILVYLTSPSYILILFDTTAGNFIMIAGGLYMMIGILVMRQMINFDF
ncbi:MAG: type II secretion system F family protein [Siculibacillus sp.]